MQRFTEIERRDRHIPLILKLDANWQPIRWLHWQDAVVAYCTEKIVYSPECQSIRLHGGISSLTGQPSYLDLPSIIACNDQTVSRQKGRKAPALSNRELFRRDGMICMYCGKSFVANKLTRDHIVPTSRGGKNTWTNVATACKRCNHAKADRLPEEAGMQLIAVPFQPNPAEYLILQNRRIISDQMEFLKDRCPKDSRILKLLS